MGKKKGKKLKNTGLLVDRLSMSRNIVKKSKKKNKKSKATTTVAMSSPASTSKRDKGSSKVVGSSTHATVPVDNANGLLVANKDKGNKGERIPGFIFMCNGKTKPECYKYRVFGLPPNRIDVVEKIKPRAKLFLFDTDLKLLYGAYEASSKGMLRLEPAAFEGRFPAQIKFKIYKDCLPLPETAFRHAIKDNYQTSTKFSPELSNKQVKSLLSLFRPITVPPPSSFPTPNVPPPPRSFQNIDAEEHFLFPPRLAPPEDPYSSGLHAVPAPPPVFALRSAPRVPSPAYGHYGHAAPVTHDQTLESLRAQHASHSRRTAPYHLTAMHEEYEPENPVLFHNNRYESYPRHEPAGDIFPRERFVGHEVPHALPSSYVPATQVVHAREPPVSYHNYPDMPIYENRCGPYGDSSARRAPVSSLYSFAGASRVYR